MDMRVTLDWLSALIIIQMRLVKERRRGKSVNGYAAVNILGKIDVIGENAVKCILSLFSGLGNVKIADFLKNICPTCRNR